MSSFLKIVSFGGAVTLALTAVPVMAQSNEELVDKLEACAALMEDAARLACYDTTVADARRIAEVAEERERVRTVEDFGLSGTQIARQEEKLAEKDPALAESLRAARDPGEPGQITATVLEVYSANRSGKRLFVLDNGQIWQETTVSRMKRNPRVNQEVTINRARFGSFRLRVEGKQGFVAVKRIK